MEERRQMSAEQYSRFLETLGQRVLRTESTWWYESSRGVFQHFPWHIALTPGRKELSDVFSSGGLLVRYACPIKIELRIPLR
jgi:hypothetical protein